MLYQKYRPKTFKELIGQPHIKEILVESLKQKRVAHAYLFSGPRGTGKTSTARLLAKALNCENPKGVEPCNKCANCLAFLEGNFMDLIEIDAASNRGIDNIRDLRDKIAFAPSKGKYKVYIIDEVHMLSKEAFNALLKTLEEPPKNVIFVLATTEPFAVPKTIVSRCQRFDFKPLSATDIYNVLKEISRIEKIKIDKEGLRLISVYSQGSLRDALSFLDQLSSLRAPINEDKVKKTLGIIEIGGMVKIFELLFLLDVEVIKAVRRELEKGFSANNLINSMLSYLEDILFIKSTGETVSPQPKEIVAKMKEQASKVNLDMIANLYELLLKARYQTKDIEVESLPLEVAILNFINFYQNDSPPKFINNNFSESEKNKFNENCGDKDNKEIKKISKKIKNIKKPPLENFDEKWKEVIKEIKKINHSISVFLSKSEVKFRGENIEISVPYKLYYNVINSAKVKKHLNSIIHKVFHYPFNLSLNIEENKGEK